jgi:hypothetical protein
MIGKRWSLIARFRGEIAEGKPKTDLDQQMRRYLGLK